MFYKKLLKILFVMISMMTLSSCESESMSDLDSGSTVDGTSATGIDEQAGDASGDSDLRAFPVEVGGIIFDNTAFVDTIVSHNYTGGFSYRNPAVVPTTWQETVIGSELQSWQDYDEVTDPSMKDPSQIIEVGFTDNQVVNGPGPDVVIFEQGNPNGILVALEPQHLETNTLTANTVLVLVSYLGSEVQEELDYTMMNAGYLDLSDLGVPEGEAVDRLSYSTYLPNGSPISPYWVPEVAAIGALYVAPPGNWAPEVSAGADQTIELPVMDAALDGVVTDDGLPSGSVIVTQWRALSGPGAVTFADDAALDTVASFSAAGVYELELWATDGDLDATDTVLISITEPDVTAPSVPSAVQAVPGSDSAITVTWTASTDNVGVVGYEIFRDGVSVDTVTSNAFSDSGLDALTSYSYEVEAFDASGNRSGLSTAVSATTFERTYVIDVAVQSSSDDAEQLASGGVQLTSSDLEMVQDLSTQTIGLRFAGVDLPANATITQAYIEFVTDEANSEATTLTISAEATGDAATFTASANNISSRALVPAQVVWSNVPAWNNVGEEHQTPNIASVVQELVDNGNWASGNAMAFVISGSGKRVAMAYDNNPLDAPLLHVEYVPSNQAPVVNAGVDQIVTLPSTTATLSGSVVDDDLPDNAVVTTSWSVVSGPGAVVFSDETALSTDVTFDTLGVYELALSATDTELVGSDTLFVTVMEVDTEAPTMVTNVSATPISDVAVGISFDVASDNVGVVGYDVYRDGVLVGTTETTSYTDTGLSGSTEYSYTVYALDASGNVSAASDAAVATTFDTIFELSVSVAASSDDAEELGSGYVELGSSDLELVQDSSTQTIGVRFAGLGIPAEATIVDAHLEFVADETNSEVTSLTISAEDSENAATFASVVGDISSRATIGSVVWENIAAWDIVGQVHQSSDIASLIQQVIEKDNWAAGNAMAFIISGSGKRVAESYNGDAQNAPKLVVRYVVGPAVNEAPVVSAGSDNTVALPNMALLEGVVTDDDLPTGIDLVIEWSQVNGPGTVVFGDVAQPETSATFSVAGTYELQLSATDTEFSVSDTVTITVHDADTTAPSVPVGLTAVALSNTEIALTWTASTDNIGVTGYNVYRDGVLVSTLSETNWVDSGLATTTEYSYTVNAFDGSGNVSAASDAALVTTLEQTELLQVAISSGADDAEELANGGVQLASSDLEMIQDSSEQTVGLRFEGIDIPRDSYIVAAHLEFTADEANAEATTLSIAAEATDNAPAFAGNLFGLSSRTTGAESVSCVVEPWSSVGETHDSCDLAPVIQELVDRGTWQPVGGAVALLITGSGKRVAVSYDNNPSAAPVLHIEYVPSVIQNQAPVVNAGVDQTVYMPSASAVLAPSVSDDGLPSSSVLSGNWSMLSGPGTVTFDDPASLSTTAHFDVVGSYELQLSVTDGELATVDTVAVTVLDPGSQVYEVNAPVSASTDDAEQLENDSVQLTSSDLELTFDSGVGQNQVVGVRFAVVNVPVGAIVTDAYIEFVADQVNTGVTSLVIEAEDSDNPVTFSSSMADITDRPILDTDVIWNAVEPWATIDTVYQTPSVSTLVQTLVNRSGWVSGNAMVFIISGTGQRTAVSFNQNPALAPVLHIEYQL